MVKTNFLVDRALAFHIEQTGGAGGHISDKRQGLLRLMLPWESTREDVSDLLVVGRDNNHDK
jgi:hypothetical protein